jgi:hypothetical protein
MRSSLVRSLISSTFGYSVVNASILRKVSICLNLTQKLLRVPLLAMPPNLTLLESLTNSPLELLKFLT